MMLWIVLIFLGTSIYLYCLLAGADFGVGVHELFVKADQRRAHEEIVKDAMGPVWEANHMWLIIAVVILFVGFPKVYAELSINLHIPITLMLIGIIMRGCAFAFRHYDAVEDGARKYYSLIFSISSIVTPVALGIIIGSMMLGNIQPVPDRYLMTFIYPWLNLYSFAVGLFVLSIFTFMAGTFMIGEKSIGLFKDKYIVRARIVHILMIVAGGLVFVTAAIEGFSLMGTFIAHPVSLIAMSLATVSHFFFWRLLEAGNIWGLRFLAGFQLLMIVIGWMAQIFPGMILYSDGSTLSLLTQAAPDRTIFLLGMALIIGSILFLPLLGYLFVVFKRVGGQSGNI
ncbi:cytochrome d ubiquinol oxidase subunit II [Candidatus Neomarinimicrobiota bacterium]